MATNSWLEIPSYGSPSWKSPVVNAAALPATGNTNGDTRVDLNTDTIYIWNGTSWLAVATPGAAIAIDGLIGDVSASGPGVVTATVNSVGGQSAASVAAATTLVETAHSGNVVLASPANGSSGVATFRSLVIADLPAGTGTVTSVGLSAPGLLYSVSGSPVTTSGTLTLNLVTQSANTVLAGPSSGVAATPTFRSLVGSDFTGSFTPGSVIFAGASGQLSQDNSEFFWDDTNFALGVGTIPSTLAVLDLVNNSGSTKSVQTTGYGSTVGYRGRYANGTLSLPTATTSGNIINFLSGRGYGATGFAATSTGAININAAGSGVFNDTSMPTSISFNVTPTGSVTSAQNMLLSSTGNLVLGLSATDNSLAQLQVNSATQSQLYLGYSSTYYSTFLQDSTGNLTVTVSATGTSNTANLNLNAGAGVSTGGSGGNVNINSGAPTALATYGGGNINLVAANGSSTGSGGVGGQVNITGGNAQGDNSVNNVGGRLQLTSGNSVGDIHGANLQGNAGNGGTGTGTAGASGGTVSFTGGTGGIGSATSGVGGNANYTAGTGGAGTAGGNGGTTAITGGTAGGGSTPGTGGSATFTGGAAAAVAGSNGGATTVSGGAGTSTGSGGAGGGLSLNGGNAGGDNTVNKNGGAITITAGTSKGGSNGASITVAGGAGGLGTGAAGASGGPVVINPGTGGNNATTSGNGGGLTLSGGLGGSSGTPGAGGTITFRTAATTSYTTRGTVTAAGNWGFGNNTSPTYLVDALGGNIGVGTAGNGYRTKEGSNAKQGTATLSGGSATVANSSVTATSRIFLTNNASAGTPGFIYISARSAGTSFTITSSSGSDTSVIAYEIFEPY